MKKYNFKLIYFLLSLSIIFAGSAFAQETVNTCLECHLQLDDALQAPALKIKDDVHSKNGLSCSSCHSGDPTESDAELSMNAKKGFIGTPNALQIPEFCGKCHSDPAYMRKYNPSLQTDQLDQYKTSHHGQLNRKGDRMAAQCVSCHGVHDILGSKDPRSKVYSKNVPSTCGNCHSNAKYMASYKIATDQFDKYEKSVHGMALLQRGDTGAPACNDCHGNHAAMPPGITSIGRVCYQCHLAEGELFNASPHKEAFDAMGEAECAFCHGNHDIHPLVDKHIGVGENALCINCHSEGDEGYKAAGKISEMITKLSTKYEVSKKLIDDAEQKGVEVSDEQYKLLDVRSALINVRTLIHSFNVEQVKEASDKAMVSVNEVYKAGEDSVKEVKNRRSGFWVFTLISILLMVFLYMKIKKMENK